MYYELSKKEINNFIEKYLNPNDPYIKLIYHISRFEYNNVLEYRINFLYTLRIYT